MRFSTNISGMKASTLGTLEGRGNCAGMNSEAESVVARWVSQVEEATWKFTLKSNSTGSVNAALILRKLDIPAKYRESFHTHMYTVFP